MRNNRKTTIIYGDRTYCHQQVEALTRALLHDGYSHHLHWAGGSTGYVSQLEQLRSGLVFRAAGRGSTIWLAMACAVARTRVGQPGKDGGEGGGE